MTERGPGQLDPYDFDADSEQAERIELEEHLAWVRENGSPEEKAALAQLDETDPAAGLEAVPEILRPKPVET